MGEGMRTGGAFLLLIVATFASELQRRTLNVTDPSVGHTLRHYAVSIPSSYSPKRATPLLLYFHGQGVTWTPTDQRYHELGERHDFITAYPRGSGDYDGRD